MNLAAGALCCKEAHLLTAVAAIKFIWNLLGMKIQKWLGKFKRHWNFYFTEAQILLQVFNYLQSGSQDDSELFPRLSKDTTVKIIHRLIKRIFFQKMTIRIQP